MNNEIKLQQIKKIFKDIIKSKTFIFQKRSYVILTMTEHNNLLNKSLAYDRIKEFIGKH